VVVTTTYYRAEGDTYSPIKVKLVDANGTHPDLSAPSTEVKIRVRSIPDYTLVFEREAEIVDVPTAEVQYGTPWVTPGDDLDAADYYLDFVVTYPDGTQETFGNGDPDHKDLLRVTR